MNLAEQDVLANGIHLHIYRTATGRPPLVFAHGITDNGLCFMPIAEKLSDKFEIILYDSRNHGKSEAPAARTTLVDRARDLAGLVDALQLKKPGLIGHSLGAVTVGLLAGLYPHLPGRIVLEDPPLFAALSVRDKTSLLDRSKWKELAALNRVKSIDELMEINRNESPAWSDAERLPWAQSKQQVNLAVFEEEFIEAEQGNQLFSQITCPTLIITADADRGALYPPHAADALAAALPAGRHVHIPGAGHNIRREQPAAFLDAVENFLKDPL